jgi:hypothetical protein
MNRPPVLMRVHIQGKEKGFGLWLPLFLLIPLGLTIALSPLNVGNKNEQVYISII